MEMDDLGLAEYRRQGLVSSRTRAEFEEEAGQVGRNIGPTPEHSRKELSGKWRGVQLLANIKGTLTQEMKSVRKTNTKIHICE